MAEYTLAHVGINGANPEEARKAAELFCTLFGFTAKEGNNSIFAGSGIEVMKEPYKGTTATSTSARPTWRRLRRSWRPGASPLTLPPPSTSPTAPSTPSI